MVELLIKNGLVISMNPQMDIIKGGTVAINDGRIVGVGKTKEMIKTYRADKVIDAKDKAILPGLINTHAHLFQSLLKGLGDGLALNDWLRKIIFPIMNYMTPKIYYYGALLGCIEMIKSGITSVLDFQYMPEMSKQVIKVFHETGIRGILGKALSDTGKDLGMIAEEQTDKIVTYAEQAIKKWHNIEEGRIRVMLCPSTILDVTPQLLQEIRRVADLHKVNISMHLSETKFEVEYALKHYGLTEARYLEKIGFLGSDVLAVHCINLSDEDIQIFKKHNVKVSYNPISNIFLASGIAPISKMVKQGLTIGLGTDSAASSNNQDMLELMKFASLLQNIKFGDPRALTANKVLKMATTDGARALGLETEIGSIELNKKADIIVINLREPRNVPLHDPISNLVYCANGGDVDTVVVDGKVLMENRTMKTVDETRILRSTQKASEDLVSFANIN